MYSTIIYHARRLQKVRERNLGLYTADQTHPRDCSAHSPQNPTGNRRGLECPEERDFSHILCLVSLHSILGNSLNSQDGKAEKILPKQRQRAKRSPLFFSIFAGMSEKYFPGTATGGPVALRDARAGTFPPSHRVIPSLLKWSYGFIRTRSTSIARVLREKTQFLPFPTIRLAGP